MEFDYLWKIGLNLYNLILTSVYNFCKILDISRPLFRYTKTMVSGSSRRNVSLHRVLKTVKDFAEQMWSQVVISVKH